MWKFCRFLWPWQTTFSQWISSYFCSGPWSSLSTPVSSAANTPSSSAWVSSAMLTSPCSSAQLSTSLQAGSSQGKHHFSSDGPNLSYYTRLCYFIAISSFVSHATGTKSRFSSSIPRALHLSPTMPISQYIKSQSLKFPINITQWPSLYFIL